MMFGRQARETGKFRPLAWKEPPNVVLRGPITEYIEMVERSAPMARFSSVEVDSRALASPEPERDKKPLAI